MQNVLLKRYVWSMMVRRRVPWGPGGTAEGLSFVLGTNCALARTKSR
jgi:hypothetical protein